MAAEVTSVDLGPGLRYDVARGARHAVPLALVGIAWAAFHVLRAAQFMREVAGEEDPAPRATRI